MGSEVASAKKAAKAGVLRPRWGLIVGVGLVAVTLTVGLRVFGLQAFKVPSGSMFPSVELGDHLFVTKSSYGFLTKSAPARGDVVIFESPEPNLHAERVDYVKRVIGLPGDELVFESGAPVINGWHVPRCLLGTGSAQELGVPGEVAATKDYEVFVEFLEGTAYLVALENGRSDGVQGPYRIKAEEFWVVGDNRNNSADSRSWNGGRGAGVPFENLKGRARWLWLPGERAGLDLAGPAVLPASFQQLEPELERCLGQAPDLQHSTPPPARH
jgi:signal peptidase I